MTIRNLQALQVNATGATRAIGAATGNLAIPNNASGQKARFVRVYCTSAAYIAQGTSVVTATTTDMPVDAGSAGSVILNCNGATHVACLQQSAAGTMTLTPLDD